MHCYLIFRYFNAEILCGYDQNFVNFTTILKFPPSLCSDNNELVRSRGLAVFIKLSNEKDLIVLIYDTSSSDTQLSLSWNPIYFQCPHS